jgi:hypothetical protein
VVWLLCEDFSAEQFRYSLIQWHPRIWTAIPPHYEGAPVHKMHSNEEVRVDFYQNKSDWSINLGDIYIKTLNGETALYYLAIRSIYIKDIYFCMKLNSILNCSNIGRQYHRIPREVNLKRIKKNKKELISYYTLYIKPSLCQKSTILGGDFIPRRLHLVRGHFKRYTPSAPLFGKFSGLYWWQPHVRGDLKEGIVVKDYAL